MAAETCAVVKKTLSPNSGLNRAFCVGLVKLSGTGENQRSALSPYFELFRSRSARSKAWGMGFSMNLVSLHRSVLQQHKGRLLPSPSPPQRTPNDLFERRVCITRVFPCVGSSNVPMLLCRISIPDWTSNLMHSAQMPKVSPITITSFHILLTSSYIYNSIVPSVH